MSAPKSLTSSTPTDAVWSASCRWSRARSASTPAAPRSNHAHIGNLRTFLFEDLLCRTFTHLGYRVRQVMNLTDVDDKTIRAAAEQGVTLAAYTEPYIASFFSDLDRLQVRRAERYPKATEHVPEMIALVARLVERGAAYVSDGSVWFRIASDPDYGRLSGIDPEAVRRGERVASDEYEKEDVRDFVLWKGAKEGEPAWDSPWGPGRPGWHIECSAMAMKYWRDVRPPLRRRRQHLSPPRERDRPERRRDGGEICPLLGA